MVHAPMVKVRGSPSHVDTNDSSRVFSIPLLSLLKPHQSVNFNIISCLCSFLTKVNLSAAENDFFANDIRWFTVRNKLYSSPSWVFFPVTFFSLSDQLKRRYNLGQYYLEVDLQDLTSYDEQLADKLTKSPAEFLPLVSFENLNFDRKWIVWGEKWDWYVFLYVK